MKKAYDAFLKILEDTKNIGVVYIYLENMPTPLDYSDLLRWQWVQAVSALDKLVHDLVRIGLVEIYSGQRRITPKAETFPITLNTHIILSKNIAPIISNRSLLLFNNTIADRHSFLSFQTAETISDALSYIWNVNDKWSKISHYIGMDKKDVVTMLRNIVIRRNQIVHEGDYPSMQLSRNEITKMDADYVIIFIQKIGEAIYNLVK